MHELSFKFNYKHRNSVRKTTSSMKDGTTHRRQSTGTSKEILDNSFSNNITTTNSDFFVCKIGGYSARASEFSMLLLLSISTIISPISDITAENARSKWKREANEKERANKTARVKWGRGKREANGK